MEFIANYDDEGSVIKYHEPLKLFCFFNSKTHPCFTSETLPSLLEKRGEKTIKDGQG
jgi:hypothetical protein